MTTCQALHEKFFNTSTIGFTVLRFVDKTFQNNPVEFIDKFAETYRQKVEENSANKDLHDAFRILLCYEYQLKYEGKAQYLVNYCQKHVLDNLRELLHCSEDDEAIRIIVNDIIILQTALHLDYSQLLLLFKELTGNNKHELREDKKLQDCLQNVKNIISALNLKTLLFEDGNTKSEQIIYEIQTLLLEEINVCFQVVDENSPQEWRAFIILLLSTLSTFESSEVVQSLWELISQYTEDGNKAQTLLCGIINDLLDKTHEEIISINLYFCMNNDILHLVSSHLASNSQLRRKRARCVLRSIVDYLKRHHHHLQVQKNNNELHPPFCFCKHTNSSIKEVEHNFFLLLESLEEKQTHLVVPALSHLNNLVEASINHKCCGNCFDSTWLKCIFIRLFHHDNNIVIKTGLIQLLRMDPQLFTDDLIAIITEALNNTFLYDEYDSSSQPQILKEISELFVKSEKSQVDFIKKFLVAVSKIAWSPFPLFYIFEALANNQIDEVKCNVWRKEELEALKVIAEKNLKLQTKLICSATQVNILKCINTYVKPPVNLFMLVKVLTELLDKELLQRGNDNWVILANYLQQNVPDLGAMAFIRDYSCQLFRNDVDDSNIECFAILTILLQEDRQILSKKPSNLNYFMPLMKLISSLHGADKRPYIDLSLCLKAIKIITSCLHITNDVANFPLCMNSTWMEDVLNLIMKGLQSKMPQSYGEANVYVGVLVEIIKANFALPKHNMNIFNNFMNKLRNEAMRILEENNCNRPILHLWYALNILYLCNKSIYDAKRISYNIPTNFITNNSNGKIVSECYGLLAKIQFQLLLFSEESLSLASEIEPLSEVNSDHAISSITGSLAFIMAVKRDNVLLRGKIVMKKIIDKCWRTLWNMNRTTQFWKALRTFIELIVNEHFLQEDDLKELALDYVKGIVGKTENVLGIRYILFFTICRRGGEIAFIFQDTILSSILHLDIGIINKRIEIQTYWYIVKHHGKLLQMSDTYNDVTIHAKLIESIIKIIMWNAEDLGNVYVPKLISMLEQYKTKRYYSDSHLHRMKHRIMQILLLLTPHLNLINMKKVHDMLSDLILAESNQPSVRIIQEWILIKIYLSYEEMRDYVWTLFPAGRKIRPGSITSLVSIVYHVAKKLSNDSKFNYIQKAVDQILPSCFSQQFVVRLYSQVVLSKLFEMLDEIDTDYSRMYASIKAAVQESLQYGNLMTNSLKLFDNFYFAIFDPVEDYNLQTIFYEIPRLSNIRMDEWIDPQSFETLMGYQSLVINVKSRKELSCIEVTQVFKENEYTPELDSVQKQNALADIQKKIIPVTPMFSNAEEAASTTPCSFRTQMVTEDIGLIVIASLIEGFPNLGGLARTAEIFCARELILKSKTYVENKDFRSLSVTAEKWITISEVKPHELRDYLLQKKSEGWNLVGAEQTANSISLQDMKFKKKSVLLLGNEKNGIPADLIQLLDVCVEIPQAGVIRSLNVHVTGAICMWQYANQHVFKCP